MFPPPNISANFLAPVHNFSLSTIIFILSSRNKRILFTDMIVLIKTQMIKNKSKSMTLYLALLKTNCPFIILYIWEISFNSCSHLQSSTKQDSKNLGTRFPKQFIMRSIVFKKIFVEVAMGVWLLGEPLVLVFLYNSLCEFQTGRF